MKLFKKISSLIIAGVIITAAGTAAILAMDNISTDYMVNRKNVELNKYIDEKIYTRDVIDISKTAEDFRFVIAKDAEGLANTASSTIAEYAGNSIPKIIVHPHGELAPEKNLTPRTATVIYFDGEIPKITKTSSIGGEVSTTYYSPNLTARIADKDGESYEYNNVSMTVIRVNSDEIEEAPLLEIAPKSYCGDGKCVRGPLQYSDSFTLPRLGSECYRQQTTNCYNCTKCGIRIIDSSVTEVQHSFRDLGTYYECYMCGATLNQ